MNAFSFRLVYSECRAMYVPVAPRRRAARRGRGGAGRRLRRALAAAGAALACGAMAAPHRSPSGVPVIDIVAPDANGLSHNRLREFDVGPPGLVFNNSLTEGRSQLAGYLNRNPGLRQAATAILTEITGTRPSRLHGALEVFGRRADLIVANPNGLSVDGLVTLNAGRLTLSTGRPVTEGGRLRLDVDAGHIAVAGAGVNTSGLDYFDLVARTVSLDGPVAAGAGARVAALAVVAGRNRFEPANGSVTPLAGSAGSGGSGYAIDGTAAGAMYGARITLLSSDSGVGVRQRGAVSSPGAITVSSRGEIRLREATAGAGHLAVDAGGGGGDRAGFGRRHAHCGGRRRTGGHGHQWRRLVAACRRRLAGAAPAGRRAARCASARGLARARQTVLPASRSIRRAGPNWVPCKAAAHSRCGQAGRWRWKPPRRTARCASMARA